MEIHLFNVWQIRVASPLVVQMLNVKSLQTGLFVNVWMGMRVILLSGNLRSFLLQDQNLKAIL